MFTFFSMTMNEVTVTESKYKLHVAHIIGENSLQMEATLSLVT